MKIVNIINSLQQWSPNLFIKTDISSRFVSPYYIIASKVMMYCSISLLSFCAGLSCPLRPFFRNMLKE